MKMITALFLCLFFLTTHQSKAQVFQETIGHVYNEYGSDSKPTADGGFITVGSIFFIPGNSYDVYLIKTDSNGLIEWTHTIGSSSLEEAYSVQITTDGGFIIGGITYSFLTEEYDMLAIRTDSLGNVLWSRSVGGASNEGAYDVKQTMDGGFILTGFTLSFSAGFGDVYLVKLDAAGNLEWTHAFGGAEGESGRSVVQTPDGGFFVVGYSLSFGNGNDDVYLIRTDGMGNHLWSKTYGGTYEEFGFSALATADGGCVIGGYRHQEGTLFFVDAYLMKTDSLGNLEWDKSYGGSLQDYCMSIAQCSDGGFVLAGTSNSFGAVNTDFFAMKTDESGNIVWAKTYGGIFDHRANSVSEAPDDGFIICGYYKESAQGYKDVCLIRTDANGNSGCNENTVAIGVQSPVTVTTTPATHDTTGGTLTLLSLPGSAIGDVFFFCTTAMEENENESLQVFLFPNPTDGNFTLQLLDETETAWVEISDVQGQVVYETKVDQMRTMDIPTDQWPVGIYFVRVSYNEICFTQKLVVKGNN